VAVEPGRYEVIEQNFLDFSPNLEPHWQTFDCGRWRGLMRRWWGSWWGRQEDDGDPMGLGLKPIGSRSRQH